MARKLKPIEDFDKWAKNLSILKIAEMSSRDREGYSGRKALDVIIKRVLTGRYYHPHEDIIKPLTILIKNKPEIKKDLDTVIINSLRFEKGKLKDRGDVSLLTFVFNYLGKEARNTISVLKKKAPLIYKHRYKTLYPIEHAKEKIKEVKDKSTKLPNKKFKLENTLEKMVKEING
jgi:hypothetical protein